MHILKIIFLATILTFSFSLLDVQAKGGGKGGGGMEKGSTEKMHSRSGMGHVGKNHGNIHQQGRGSGQIARDGSCVNNSGQGKGSGKQMMNNNQMQPNNATGRRSQ